MSFLCTGELCPYLNGKERKSDSYLCDMFNCPWCCPQSNKRKEAKLDVDQRTAETCLRIVEAYINQHKNAEIVFDETQNGERKYELWHGPEPLNKESTEN